jgi:outer membrane beta-barrel protein
MEFREKNLKTLLSSLFLTLMGFCCMVAQAQQRAVDDLENVKAKIYPKDGKVELAVPSFGMVITSPFVQTMLVHGGLTYFTDEESGWGVEGFFAVNGDTNDRKCLESFYNDPQNNLTAECGAVGDSEKVGTASAANTNYGPAYVPVRELKMLVAANYVWNPIYGKQLFFLSATNHFDVFFTLGLGVAMSDYFPEQTVLRNGKNSRAVFREDTNTLEGGAAPSETASYGEEGRPDSEAQTTPFVNLGFSQRFHMTKMIALRFELRDMLLLGTPGGFENYIAILGGVSFRF